MNSLYYTTHKPGNTVVDGKVTEDPKEYINSIKGDFFIQIFGKPIMPKDAISPLFKVRNLVMNVSCTFVGTERDNSREAHISEACHRTKDINKQLVVINCISFDNRCEEIADAIDNLYEIINHEAKKSFGVVEDTVVYWELSDDEFELLKKHCRRATVNIENNQYYVILQK